MRLILVCLLLANWSTSVVAEKILGIWSMASYSHFTLGNRLMRELALRGHDVTFVSPYKDNNPPKNYKDITLTGLAENMDKHRKNINFLDLSTAPIIVRSIVRIELTLKISEDLLSSSPMQELIHSNSTFDLILIEQFFNDALRGLQYHFNAPCVLVSSIGPSSMINYIVANPLPVSFISDIFMEIVDQDMSFSQRFFNSIFSTMADIYYRTYALRKHNAIMQKYFPTAPHLDELLYDTPLILLNSHISTSRPVPLATNMVEIGGYHVYPPKKLPEHLQKYLDDAKEGVILFSMGSNVKSADLPDEKRNALLKAFGTLTVKVLWKWEDEELAGKPDNVHIEKWLPQQDILPHKNVKLFITHGGLLSTTEAIYHGVPVIGIPIFGDQQVNMALAKNAGYGIPVRYSELNEKTITEAINQILTNSEYTTNAKKRQKLHHDRAMTAIDTAMYHIEYVLRNPESEIYRSPGTRITWYQAYLLDVLGALLVLGILLVALIVYICKFFYSLMCKRKTNNLSNMKKNT